MFQLKSSTRNSACSVMSVTSGATKSHSWLRVADNVCNTLMMSTTDNVYNTLFSCLCDATQHVLKTKNSKHNFCVMSHCHMLAVCCTTICVLVHKTKLNLKCLVFVGVTNVCLGGRGSAECSELTNAYGSLRSAHCLDWESNKSTSLTN